jgi:hypothetical protein
MRIAFPLVAFVSNAPLFLVLLPLGVACSSEQDAQDSETSSEMPKDDEASEPESDDGSAGSGSEGASGDGSGSFSYSECEPGTKVGSFVIDLAPDYEGVPQFTSITGSVSDGPAPSGVPEVVAEDGDCRLLRSRFFDCDPVCTALETCGPTGCAEFPEQRSVGDVTISGLVVPMTMSPTGRNSYSNPTSANLPHPGFEPETELVLNAVGDTTSGFELYGWGVSPMSVPGALPQVRRDQPTQIRWDAPPDPGPAMVYVALHLDNHGSSSARVECLTVDDGELDIDASLGNQLVEQGLSGFPSLTLHRRTVDRTDIEPGCVEFVVGSELVIDVEVEGLVNCASNDDCPDDQQCLPNLSCG